MAFRKKAQVLVPLQLITAMQPLTLTNEPNTKCESSVLNRYSISTTVACPFRTVDVKVTTVLNGQKQSESLTKIPDLSLRQ